MSENSRLDDLRRRIERDPASIAFAQLAEEYRRAGDYQQAVDVCRSGLEIHPGYLSARVTLGRALLELNDLDGAQTELEQVLHHAPENLAAIRGLADIHHRRGRVPDALAQYRAALALARNDPDLERTVEELSREVAPPPPPEPADAVSVDRVQRELRADGATSDAPPSRPESSQPATPPIADTIGTSDHEAEPPPRDVHGDECAEPAGRSAGASVVVTEPSLDPTWIDAVALHEEGGTAPTTVEFAVATASAAPTPTQYNVVPDATRERAGRTITALERWLVALNGLRPDSRA